MAIYLDANILWSWRTFDEADRLVVSIVAHQLGQKVYIPAVAAREAEETYRRKLAACLDGYNSALDQLHRWFDIDSRSLEPPPSIDDALEAWKTRLALLAETLPTDPRDAADALEREIVGRSPTKKRAPQKPGSGARDAAIWLTVLRHHKDASESGIFITKNSNDFATDGVLKTELAAELANHAHPLELYLSLEQLIESLGKSVDAPTIELDELRQLGESSLVDALTHRPDLISAYWSGLKPHLRYGSHVHSARPVRIWTQRRYERDDEAVTLIDADWDLSVEPLYQDIDTETPDEWHYLKELDVLGRIQMFVPERAHTRQPAQLITGRWSPSKTLWMGDSGRIITSTSSI